MKQYNKVAVLSLSTLIILSNICFVSAAALPATNQKQIKGDLLATTNSTTISSSEPKGCHGCGRGPMLRKSVDQMQQSGTLSDEDVKNIDTFMKKERQAVQSEIQDKIYKEECTKIDKMVSEKVISKDQGDKLKAVVKENMQNCN